MEHPCYRCGAQVEDGISFCPQCSAPQIRVALPEQQSIPIPMQSGIPLPQVISPSGIIWRDAIKVAILCGCAISFISVLSAALLPAGFVLWTVLGGAACVAMYERRHPSAPVSAGFGARLGTAAGAIASLLFGMIQTLAMFTVSGDEIRATIREKLQQAAAQNPDPRAQEIAVKLMTPEGMALMVALAIAMMLVLFLVFGAVGGALWGSLHRRNQRPPL